MTKTTLPDEVILHLFKGRKVEAIKLLRVIQGLDLTSAKQSVEQWLAEKPVVPAAGSRCCTIPMSLT